MFTPTSGQKECTADIVDWHTYDRKQGYVILGAAGTGKTTLVTLAMKELRLEADEVLIVAYTGKAASVLMQKGFNASTIHSAFFEPALIPVYIDGKPVIREGRTVKKLGFVPKSFIDPRIKLIVLDECGMVNEEFRDIIFKFGVPVLALGDDHQLPPIFGISPFFNDVDYRLVEITRQAKDSGIITLATAIRQGEDIPVYHNYFNDAYVMSKKFLKKRHLLEADMILTAKNKTRNQFNNKLRELHGSTGPLPNVGDKLVCRKNNWGMSLDGIPLINGTLGKVVNPIRRSECNFDKSIYRIDFQPDFAYGYNYYEALPCDYDYLIEPCGNKTINRYNFGIKMEYGEAITVHLSQGSQYNKVVYWDEWMGDRDYMMKLRYTAVTRAVNKVYMFV